MPRSLVSPDDQKVTFVELFFDLVFVFSVTQVVGVLHDGITWRAIGEAVLVFWLVWWGWTQFTWALNAADTTHPRVELATLLATGVAFFLAVGVPSAFHGSSLWFAGAYVAVRVLGLLVYDWVAWVDPAQRAAVRLFSAVSVAGLAAVLIGGYLGGGAQYLWWGIAIVLDIIAAGIGGGAEGWNLRPEHFAERHGLFTIIALGESLIVAATGLTEGPWPASVVTAAAVAVAVTGALWWSYFTRAKPDLDRSLEEARGVVRSRLARDAFSILHFPILCGVIAYAASVEEILAHPADPLEPARRILLGAAVVLFSSGLAVALRRAEARVSAARIWVPLATALAVAIAPVHAVGSLTMVLAGMLTLAVSEGGAPSEHTAMR